MATYFFSDIHIENSSDWKFDKFVKVLDNISEDAENVILLGDIFDFWVGHNKYFVEKFNPIINQFSKMVNRGIKFYYVEGNHDFNLQKFFHEKLGFKVLADELNLTLYGKKIRVEHGDLMDSSVFYLAWRRFVRSCLIKFVMVSLPAKCVDMIGCYLSKRSKSKNPVVNRKKLDIKINNFAKKRLKLDAFDVFIFGHIHLMKDFILPGTNLRVINIGSWNGGSKYLKMNLDSIDIIRPDKITSS